MSKYTNQTQAFCHEFGNPGKDLNFESVINKWAITTFLNYENGQNNEGRVTTTILNYKLRIATLRIATIIIVLKNNNNCLVNSLVNSIVLACLETLVKHSHSFMKYYFNNEELTYVFEMKIPN
jgi:hypothetical protein